MEHQKCRICGERHRLGPCPKYGKSPAQQVLKDVKKLVKIQSELSKNLNDPSFKKKYDRNIAHRIYMREYQRRKRAERKAK